MNRTRKLLICLLILSILAVASVSMVQAVFYRTHTDTFNITINADIIDISMAGVNDNSDVFLPGTTLTLANSPTVTLGKGSEACYLFVKATKSADFDTYMSYQMAEGWTALDGVANVYYREVDTLAADATYGIVMNDQITVPATLTIEQMNVATAQSVSFAAYAVQKTATTSTPTTAWQALQG